MGNASAKLSKGGASLTTMFQVSVYHLASSYFKSQSMPTYVIEIPQ